jgi:hypothetical protein
MVVMLTDARLTTTRPTAGIKCLAVNEQQMVVMLSCEAVMNSDSGKWEFVSP